MSLVNAHFLLNGIDASKQFLAQAEKRWPNQTWVPMWQLLLHLNTTGDLEGGLAATNRAAQLEQNAVTKLYLPALVRLKIDDEKKGVEFVEEFSQWSEQRTHARKGVVKRWSQRVDEWLAFAGIGIG